jgi:hypothetical protein
MYLMNVMVQVWMGISTLWVVLVGGEEVRGKFFSKMLIFRA